MNLLLSLLLALLSSSTPAEQSQQVIIVTPAEVAEVVEAKERGWEFTPGFCTCERLVKTQEYHSLGTWERKTKKVAAKWLRWKSTR